MSPLRKKVKRLEMYLKGTDSKWHLKEMEMSANFQQAQTQLQSVVATNQALWRNFGVLQDKYKDHVKTCSSLTDSLPLKPVPITKEN